MVREIQVIKEGKYLNSFLNYRFKKNKNALIAVTGPTGSGKTYSCLSMSQHWYKFRWDEDFPSENICFSIKEVVNLLKSGKLRRGELLILEEAGTNLGSLDFQTRVSKLFTYILQSFRSMNIGLLFNLPVLTMLNKQTRQLLHMHMITKGIDFTNKKVILDCKIHQLNQHSGKSYWKYPQVLVGHKRVKLKELSYGLPPKELLEIYEERKKNFVSTLVEEYEENVTKTQGDIREEERLKENIIKTQKLEELLKEYRDEKGKLRCPMCKSVARWNKKSSSISCQPCGHNHFISL